MSDKNTANTEESTPDPRKVTVDQVLDAAREAGCVVGDLKSYHAIEAPTYNHCALYVGKAKRQVTRIDAAGFVPTPLPGLDVHDAEWAKSLNLGAVRAQVLPKTIREEDCDVLATVRSLCEQMLAVEKGFKLGKRKVESDEESTASEPEASEEDAEEIETSEEDADEAALREWELEHAAEAAAS